MKESKIRTSALALENIPTGTLIANGRNARTHSREQVDKLRRSLQEFGFVNPVLIDRGRNVIAGHGRLLAAKAEGMETVPCVCVDGMTEEQKRAYILADNRLALDAGWDDEILRLELGELAEAGFDMSLAGFDGEEEARIFKESKPRRGGDDFDAEFYAQKPALIRRGETWTLGRHRLMCADATDTDCVARLAGGDRARLLITDPPYNVAYTGAPGTPRKEIKNDDMDAVCFEEFLTAAFRAALAVMEGGSAYYIFYASTTADAFLRAMKNVNAPARSVLIWVKNHFVLSRGDYNFQHESILYGWKDGAPHRFYGAMNSSTVFDFRKRAEDMTHEELVEYVRKVQKSAPTDILDEKRPVISREHPTMKPTALLERLLKNSSKPDEFVLDTFSGSGSTLIACERTGRKCLAIELSEQYATSIIYRYVEETGDEGGAFVERNGKRVTFADAAHA